MAKTSSNQISSSFHIVTFFVSFIFVNSSSFTFISPIASSTRSLGPTQVISSFYFLLFCSITPNHATSNNDTFALSQFHPILYYTLSFTRPSCRHRLQQQQQPPLKHSHTLTHTYTSRRSALVTEASTLSPSSHLFPIPFLIFGRELNMSCAITLLLFQLVNTRKSSSLPAVLY